MHGLCMCINTCRCPFQVLSQACGSAGRAHLRDGHALRTRVLAM